MKVVFGGESDGGNVGMWLANREDVAESNNGGNEEQESPCAIGNTKGLL